MLGGPLGWSGQVRKISPSPGFNSRTLQPVAQSLYRPRYRAHRRDEIAINTKMTPGEVVRIVLVICTSRINRPGLFVLDNSN